MLNLDTFNGSILWTFRWWKPHRNNSRVIDPLFESNNLKRTTKKNHILITYGFSATDVSFHHIKKGNRDQTTHTLVVSPKIQGIQCCCEQSSRPPDVQFPFLHFLCLDMGKTSLELIEGTCSEAPFEPCPCVALCVSRCPASAQLGFLSSGGRGVLYQCENVSSLSSCGLDAHWYHASAASVSFGAHSPERLKQPSFSLLSAS